MWKIVLGILTEDLSQETEDGEVSKVGVGVEQE